MQNEFRIIVIPSRQLGELRKKYESWDILFNNVYCTSGIFFRLKVSQLKHRKEYIYK